MQELRRPVIRKLRRRIEYGLQKAFQQCQVAYDLAFMNGDAGGILKAVELQARLAKILCDEFNVNNRHGLLDDASTKVLLAMRREIEVKQAKMKRLQGSVPVEGQIVSQNPP